MAFARKMKKLKKRFFLYHPWKAVSRFPLLYALIPEYTKLSFDALSQSWDMVDAIDMANIPGAIVELGCWNGGCGALMAQRTKKNGSKRMVWLFDSFEGLPELAPQDEEWAHSAKGGGIKMRQAGTETLRPTGYYKAEEEKVRYILGKLRATDRARIVRGWFQETLPAVKDEIGPIALMRLDGDIYESTKIPLEILFDQVSDDGYIVIDDFHLKGCRQAIYEFFAERGIWPLLINSPSYGRAYFKKTGYGKIT